jgi:4-hydroxy-tetrahydrodipicolinate reductase
VYKGNKLLLAGYGGRMGTVLRTLFPFGCFRKAVPFSDIEKTDPSAIGACIDFSSPSFMEDVVRKCRERRIPLVSGTTGLTKGQLSLLKSASRFIPIVYSTNFSVGMNALFKFLPLLAKALREFDVTIVEHHHRQKKDYPSGTAKTLREKVKGTRGNGDIPIHSIRAGGVAGEHTLVFAGGEEKISVTHVAFGRVAFAQGALRAAQCLCTKKLPPGLYTLQDVLLP